MTDRRCRPDVIALALFLGSVCPAVVNATELYVATTGSDAGGNDCTNPLAPCRTIQYAIDELAPVPTIHVAAGRYVENLFIGSSVAIVGLDASTTIIDGGGATSDQPVCEIQGNNNVTLAGLTLTNGVLSRGNGGGVRSMFGIVALMDSVVTGNRTTSADNGGGVYSNGGLISFMNTRITENQAGTGGGIYLLNANFSFSNSLIANNVASTGGGFAAVSSQSLLFQRVTIMDNEADFGGGLHIDRVTTLRIDRSTISRNSAFSIGGGIDILSSDVRLINSTVSDNASIGPWWGGGIANSDIDGLRLHNCTITGNSAAGGGGGIGGINGFGTTIATNTIIAGNTAGLGPDCHQTIASEGHNLIGDPTACVITGDPTGNIVGVDPRLSPLADNGGPTMTHALATASPAIDAGDPGGCLDEWGGPLLADQREMPRPLDCGGGLRCDIGAFEGCPSSPNVYESTDRAVLGVSVGTAVSSPYNHLPAPDPVLYYHVDDGNGMPPRIKLTTGGLGLLIHF